MRVLVSLSDFVRVAAVNILLYSFELYFVIFFVFFMKVIRLAITTIIMIMMKIEIYCSKGGDDSNLLMMKKSGKCNATLCL